MKVPEEWKAELDQIFGEEESENRLIKRLDEALRKLGASESEMKITDEYLKRWRGLK